MPAELACYYDAACDGPSNMARDECLLYDEGVAPAALRLYAWEPATLSLGYFQRIGDLSAQPAEIRALPVVRRTTGGGAILHDREITYALIVDQSLPIGRVGPTGLYELAHQCWAQTLRAHGVDSDTAPDDAPLPSPRGGPFFCFEKPGRTDLSLAGRKLLGSSQRRIPGRVLQHGSLMLGQRFSAHPGAQLSDVADVDVDAWRRDFAARIADALQLALTPRVWTSRQLADVDVRRARYASPEWTAKR
ncbi:MAG: lipoate--protein ligase family protein [Phycisphaerales bacterium]|nr:lipoate--protein ligase family protein [Phycisphaerales bacterium]